MIFEMNNFILLTFSGFISFNTLYILQGVMNLREVSALIKKICDMYWDFG